MATREQVEVSIDAVRAANQAFYDAFEQRDLDAMSDLWERSERALLSAYEALRSGRAA